MSLGMVLRTTDGKKFLRAFYENEALGTINRSRF